jgi:hypothetical protein
MTQARHTPARRADLRGVAGHPLLLWCAFALSQLWLSYLNVYPYLYGLGDVTSVYRHWAEQGLNAGTWVGIDEAWVYPIGALVPIASAAFFGLSSYASTWLSLIMVLNAIAFAVLVHGAQRRVVLAWWWIAFLVLLGPIALGRIDAVTVPLAIIGILLLSRRPAAAAALLSVATWIKVWPAAIIAAIVLVSRRRLTVLVIGAVTSAVIIAIALLLGSGANVVSFIGQQTGRGMQIEAPASSIWMWQAFAGVPGATVYYDLDILTYQVTGSGVDVAAAVMTPVMAVAVAVVAALGWLARRRGAAELDVLAPLALALVTALIAFNKVGSPQFISWLSVPVLLGLATQAATTRWSFRVPAAGVLVIAWLTQLVYPVFYDRVLGLDPFALTILSLRNLLLFVLLGWAVVTLVRLARTPTTTGTPTTPGEPTTSGASRPRVTHQHEE